MINLTDTVKHLIIINVIFFVGSLFVPAAQEYLSLYYFENPDFKIWQPLTSVFMHADFKHILFNMFGLFMFGSTLERMWGTQKFLFFYLSCGIGASLISSWVNYIEFHQWLNSLADLGFNKDEALTILNQGMYDKRWEEHTDFFKLRKSFFSVGLGASGAIYGLMVAFAFLFPNAEFFTFPIPIPIKAKYLITGLLLIDLFSGLTGASLFGRGGIGHFAHLGGALIGFIMMWYWKNNQFKNNRWD
ncbi:rhomboid family intramembrane serine protease [Flavobacterium pedocola]